MCSRMKLDVYLSPYVKINSKCIKDLNIGPELLKENVGETPQSIDKNKDVFRTGARDSKSIGNKLKLVKCYFIKL
jgi:hypothetical protein